MSGEILDRARGCREMEGLVSKLYEAYANMFPGARGFWESLADDEKHHVEIMDNLIANIEITGDEVENILPSFINLSETMNLVQRGLNLISESDDHSLRKACDNALAIEETKAEMYTVELRRLHGASPFTSCLQEVLDSEEDHRAKVKDFIKNNF